MKVTMNTQPIASIARQLLAIAGIVMGVLTASDSAIHLPAGISAIFVTAGAIILAIEHYVADPTTGTGVPTSTPTPPTSAAPAAPPPFPPA